MIPRLDSVCPIFAVSLRSRKWQAIAISQPPPVAWPLTAAITGFGKRSIFRMTLLPKRMNTSTLPPENAEPRSAPPQKIRSPAPVRMTARTPASCSTELSASFSSVTSFSLIALAGGRLSVTTTKASSRSNFSVSYAIARDSFEEDGGDGIGGVGEPVRALPEDPRGRELVHRAEQHLGGDLHVQVAPDPASGDPLLEDRLDHVEVGGHLAGGRAPEEFLALAELHLDDLAELGVFLDHLEVEADDLPDFRDGLRLPRHLLAQGGDPLGHLVAEEGDENVVLGLEVEVDRAARDAGLAGDVRHARVVVPGAREDADRSVDDLLRLVRITHGVAEPRFILRRPAPGINPPTSIARVPGRAAHRIPESDQFDIAASKSIDQELASSE